MLSSTSFDSATVCTSFDLQSPLDMSARSGAENCVLFHHRLESGMQLMSVSRDEQENIGALGLSQLDSQLDTSIPIFAQKHGDFGLLHINSNNSTLHTPTKTNYSIIGSTPRRVLTKKGEKYLRQFQTSDEMNDPIVTEESRTSVPDTVINPSPLSPIPVRNRVPSLDGMGGQIHTPHRTFSNSSLTLDHQAVSAPGTCAAAPAQTRNRDRTLLSASAFRCQRQPHLIPSTPISLSTGLSHTLHTNSRVLETSNSNKDRHGNQTLSNVLRPTSSSKADTVAPTWEQTKSGTHHGSSGMSKHSLSEKRSSPTTNKVASNVSPYKAKCIIPIKKATLATPSTRMSHIRATPSTSTTSPNSRSSKTVVSPPAAPRTTSNTMSSIPLYFTTRAATPRSNSTRTPTTRSTLSHSAPPHSASVPDPVTPSSTPLPPPPSTAALPSTATPSTPTTPRSPSFSYSVASLFGKALVQKVRTASRPPSNARASVLDQTTLNASIDLTFREGHEFISTEPNHFKKDADAFDHLPIESKNFMRSESLLRSTSQDGTASTAGLRNSIGGDRLETKETAAHVGKDALNTIRWKYRPAGKSDPVTRRMQMLKSFERQKRLFRRSGVMSNI